MVDISGVEMGAVAFPPWMTEWLKIDFYETKCSVHVNKYHTVFCLNCSSGNPLCEICWKNDTNRHQGHHSLQVCTASRRAAITVNEIQRLFDVKGIQPYMNNGKNVVYLNPHNKGGSTTLDHKHHILHSTCHHCHRKLKDPHYLFCSIACKKECMEVNLEEQQKVEVEVEVDVARPKRKLVEGGSFRPAHRQRKGTPLRSPSQ